MDINLRQAVLANISANTQDELEDTIVDAIEKGEEKMLPGLGVLFELIWEQSNEADKQELIDTLEQGIKQSSNE